MLCDVASIFAVRTSVVSQAFTMVLTLTISEYTYSCTVYHPDISRAQFTGFLYVNKRNDIREPNIMLCLAVEFLSYGPSKKITQRFYQAGSVIKPHCCLTSRNQLVLTACVRPFKPGTAGLIPGS